MFEALCTGGSSWWIWGAFILFVIVLLIIDLGLFHKKTHAVSIKEALLWALVWFGLAMAFNVLVWVECGRELGLQFFTGYVIEKSLSVDNLFIILLIFTSFSIPAAYQHRVLFWGILGALVMRGLLIALGAALVARFDWVFYLFGVFLLWTGGKMLLQKDEGFNPRNSIAVRIVKKFVPVTKLKNERFFTKQNGKFAVTVLFVALMVVEFTDVVFAFDSIPAIFAITNDPFIVFTSNVFAILGLRSLYFVIARAHDLFKHLKIGLAVILLFIGLKLLLKDLLHIPIFVSLGIVIAVLITSIVYSIIEKKMEQQAKRKKKR